ncbi:diguanylate cyclase [Methylopila sp. 73B]|uniref:diguanylate cyclase domain-containing protein n=1 Tax=Methylopila sp. 73B TaxID=1120792 RepID=UPI0003722187|nr:diguanylate cyclase [Methylopila sp. 73B]
MRRSADQTGAAFARNVVAPVSALVGAMILASIAAAIWIAHHQTADLRARERSLVGSAIAARSASLEKTTNDYALWDDTFERVVRRRDEGWFEANIARPAADEYDFALVAVADPTGNALFGTRGGARFSGPLDQILVGGFRALIDRMAATGADATESGLLLLDGEPTLVAVSRIRPYTATAAAGADLGSLILVLADQVGPSQMDALAKAYLLPDLRVVPVAEDDATLPLNTLDGRRRLVLAWRGGDPGGALLRDLLPLMIVLLFAFAGMTAYVLRQGKAATIRLGESERRALLDPLTGLPNRLALYARVEGLVGAAPPASFALAYLDLDGFKQVNDEHGHELGDEVLRQAARRIASAVREIDLLVRLGGDEFAILLPGLSDAATLRQLAERVIATVSEPIDAGGVTVRVGATIGVAVSPADGRETLELIKVADAALYRGKRSRKGTVQFSLTA